MDFLSQLRDPSRLTMRKKKEALPQQPKASKIYATKMMHDVDMTAHHACRTVFLRIYPYFYIPSTCTDLLAIKEIDVV